MVESSRIRDRSTIEGAVIPPRLLSLRALGLGDLLTAVPALRGLRAAWPDHEHVLLAPAAFTSLTELIGGIDRVIETDARRAPPWNLPVEDVDGTDVAVNLHGRGPQSSTALARLRPRRLLAFDVPGGPRWDPEEHERMRWCRLLKAYGLAADPDDYLLTPPAADVPHGVTVVHPGASAPARRWPAERWAALVAAETAHAQRVVLTGDAGEGELVRRVSEHALGLGAPAERIVTAAGTTTLPQLAALVAHAARVVCGDTGVAHLAAAFRTPSVVLFGPTDPARWGPPERPEHRVLWHGRSGDPGASRPDPGLLNITVDEVMRTLGELPALTKDRSG